MACDGQDFRPDVPSAEALMIDPSVSGPLREVLRNWLQRDPVKAASDAELLSDVLGRRADEILGSFACRK